MEREADNRGKGSDGTGVALEDGASGSTGGYAKITSLETLDCRWRGKMRRPGDAL